MPRIAPAGPIGVSVFVALLLTTAIHSPTVAGREQLASKPRPGWLPHYASVSRLGNDLTAADRAEAMRVLGEIERILMQVPELGAPKGFEVMPQYSGGRPLEGPGAVLNPKNVAELSYLLYFFAPTQAIAGEGCTCIHVRVNLRVPEPIQGTTTLYGDNGEEIFDEPLRGDRVPLLTEVYGQLPPGEPRGITMVLTAGGEPYFRVVSREEYYNAVLRNLEGKDGALLAEARSGADKTPYQEWLAGAAERRKEREAAIQAAAATLPAAEVAKLRRMLEDTEREVGEQLKASQSTDRAERQEGVRQFLAAGNAIRAELKSMTPAERKLPAIYDQAGGGTLNATDKSLVDKDGPGMRRMVTPMPDFWRARKSPVEVRSIEVDIKATGTGLVPAVNHALVQTSRKLDWAALNKLLAVPR